MFSRALRGVLSGSANTVARIIIQLVQVPVFIHFWGAETYGQWLILFAIPSYLALADMGISTASANMIGAEHGAGRKERAAALFTSSWGLLTSIEAVIVSVLLALFVLLMAMPDLRVAWSLTDTKMAAIACLSVYTLLKLQGGLILSYLRACGLYARSQDMASIFLLMEFIVTVCVLASGLHAMGLALALAGSVFVQITLALFVVRYHRLLLVRVPFARFRLDAARMLKPSLFYMAFPLGNAINNQGLILVVGTAYGPLYVTMFATLRTLMRTAEQATGIVQLIAQPEASYLAQQTDTDPLRKIHRLSAFLNILIGTTAALGILVLGQWFLKIWTLGKVELNVPLFVLLCLSVWIRSLWYASAAVLSGLNRHTIMATVFVIFSIILVAVAYWGSGHFGIWWIGVAIVAGDIANGAVVMRLVMKYTQDNLIAFLRYLAGAECRSYLIRTVSHVTSKIRPRRISGK